MRALESDVHQRVVSPPRRAGSLLQQDAPSHHEAPQPRRSDDAAWDHEGCSRNRSRCEGRLCSCLTSSRMVALWDALHENGSCRFELSMAFQAVLRDFCPGTCLGVCAAGTSLLCSRPSFDLGEGSVRANRKPERYGECAKVRGSGAGGPAADRDGFRAPPGVLELC